MLGGPGQRPSGTRSQTSLTHSVSSDWRPEKSPLGSSVRLLDAIVLHHVWSVAAGGGGGGKGERERGREGEGGRGCR